MNDSYLLTVIIPLYNTEKYLSRCLDSVLNQNLKSIQIIIIDDCSTDDSFKIAQSYADKYHNIVLLQNSTRKGVGLTRNTGIEKVKTEYVCFLDSDDWVDSTTYYNAVKALQNYKDCDIGIWGIKTEYNTPYNVSLRYQYKNSNIIDKKFALGLLSGAYNQDISISSLLGNKIFKLELITRNNIKFEDLYFEDDLFSFLTILASTKIALIPDVYLHYYQRENSIMHNFSERYIEDIIACFTILKQYLDSSDKFIEYEKEYYVFFRKCTVSLFKTMFITEQKEDMQKKYFLCFISLFAEKFSKEETANFLDIDIIKGIISRRI